MLTSETNDRWRTSPVGLWSGHAGKWSIPSVLVFIFWSAVAHAVGVTKEGWRMPGPIFAPKKTRWRMKNKEASAKECSDAKGSIFYGTLYYFFFFRSLSLYWVSVIVHINQWYWVSLRWRSVSKILSLSSSRLRVLFDIFVCILFFSNIM